MFDDKYNLNTKDKLYTFLLEMSPSTMGSMAVFLSGFATVILKKKTNLNNETPKVENIEIKKSNTNYDDDDFYSLDDGTCDFYGTSGIF